MPWDHVSSRQEFLLWGRSLLRQIEEARAEVKASAEWKPELEYTWMLANTDLWSYLEALFAILEARRYDQLDWRTLAEIMESATTYE